MRHRRGTDLWKDAAAGALAGLAGAFVMSRFQALLYDAVQAAQRTAGADAPGDEDAAAGGQEREQEDGDNGENGDDGDAQEPATVEAAGAVSQQLFGHALTGREKEVAGPAVHYAFGATTGAVYGVLAGAVPAVRLGRGTLFGAVLWATADEAVVPLLGLSRAPWKYPPSTHGYALASHLVYGLVVDVLRRALRR